MTQVPATPKKPTLPTLEILLDTFIKNALGTLNCVKVGVVQAYYPGSAEQAPTVDVVIAYQQLTSIAADGTKTYAPYSKLLTVPVSFQQGGGCIHTFPIAQGDECLVLFNDNQIDEWLLGGAGQAPATNRNHDFSDAIAIVGLRSNPRGIADISATTAQLRSVDGNTFVELDPAGTVNINATTINLNAQNINVNGSAAVVLHSAAKISWDANGTGEVYLPNLITSHTDGVATNHTTPTPPGPL